LEPSTLEALYELISLVHDGVEVINQNDMAEPLSQDSSPGQSNETKMIVGADNSSLLDKVPVAKIILPVDPLELRSMLLAMVVCITYCKINLLIQLCFFYVFSCNLFCTS
jgi:hypothetical protein